MHVKKIKPTHLWGVVPPYGIHETGITLPTTRLSHLKARPDTIVCLGIHEKRDKQWCHGFLRFGVNLHRWRRRQPNNEAISWEILVVFSTLANRTQDVGWQVLAFSRGDGHNVVLGGTVRCFPVRLGSQETEEGRLLALIKLLNPHYLNKWCSMVTLEWRKDVRMYFLNQWVSKRIHIKLQRCENLGYFLHLRRSSVDSATIIASVSTFSIYLSLLCY